MYILPSPKERENDRQRDGCRGVVCKVSVSRGRYTSSLYAEPLIRHTVLSSPPMDGKTVGEGKILPNMFASSFCARSLRLCILICLLFLVSTLVNVDMLAASNPTWLKLCHSDRGQAYPCWTFLNHVYRCQRVGLLGDVRLLASEC